ncbi:IS110 family transposase, partial [Streptomyces violascens]|uniref:IS110 family transposase n=1 Tax=Streptomyces violascens TaxID=67381 RepID=UPI003695465B
MKIFCGIDWAEDHHDIALVNERGDLVAKLRISDDLAGLEALQQLLAEAGDGSGDPIPVAIETSHGLLVSCLRATDRPVYASNLTPPVGLRTNRQEKPAGCSPGEQGRALLG